VSVIVSVRVSVFELVSVKCECGSEWECEYACEREFENECECASVRLSV